jgi:RNA polymerase sigma-70 factor (ECF subfamily)
MIDKTELYELVKLIAEGDKDAFVRFYDLTISRSFGVIMKISANKELAEEIASDVYMQIWRTASKYDPDLAAPMTWLIMISRSRAIDALRREKSATKNQYPLNEDYDVSDENTFGPLAETLDEENCAKIKGLLDVLSKSERQMVVLAFYQGMSHNEIAKHTGKPLGSVKTILRRSQSALRSALKKRYFYESVTAQNDPTLCMNVRGF